ncbi:MAG: amino acid adenylation domain-containing protein [Actinomycetota bacterium]
MDQLLHHLLQRAAEIHPDRTAVEDGERSVTYSELEARSNQMAALLFEVGVERGDRVGLFLDKSIECIVGIYGALKCGAAYVPLDPRAPSARLAYIAGDCGLRVLVSNAERAASLSEWVALGATVETVIVPDATTVDPQDIPKSLSIKTALDVDRQETSGRIVLGNDGDLAYILYTSGSTGAPKGVMLSHLNALTFVLWTIERFGVSAEDRLSSHAPFHFDLSIFDLFAAAGAGAAVVLIPADLAVFPMQIKEFVAQKRLTITYAVPSLLSMLTLRGGLQHGELPELRTILFAGEIFPTKFLRRLMELLPHVDFFNLYGPTETNVCTYYPVVPIPEEQTEAIPIGRAIENVEVFALTDGGTRAQPGEVGELCVRGPSVMLGYWGDAERTERSLVHDPLGDDRSEPVYRTGDLVRQGPDGDYRLLGRRDHQIKSRGYRIELGDIEAALYAHPAVVECAAVAVPDPLVTNRITAYVVAREEIGQRDLVRFCGDRIPHYMIPEQIEFVSALPKTSTGKVDRQALEAVR